MPCVFYFSKRKFSVVFFVIKYIDIQCIMILHVGVSVNDINMCVVFKYYFCNQNYLRCSVILVEKMAWQ